MHAATITRQGSLWVFEVDGVGSGVAETVSDVNRSIAEMIGAQPGQTPMVTYTWQDPMVDQAIKLAARRVEIARLSRQLDVETREAVIAMSAERLSVRDIGHFLGITAGRVSQLRNPGLVHGPDDDSLPLHFVDLRGNQTLITGWVRGDLPPEIKFEGHVYAATGGAHEVNGGAMRHTYLLRT